MKTEELIRPIDQDHDDGFALGHIYPDYNYGHVPLGAKAYCGHIKRDPRQGMSEFPRWENCIVCNEYTGI